MLRFFYLFILLIVITVCLVFPSDSTLAQNLKPISTVGNPSAQESELSSELKKEILDSISAAIDKQAYVYGTDFSRWKTIADGKLEEFEAARTNQEFAQKVNAALGQFGVSHLNLRTPRAAQANKTGKAAGAGIYGLPKKDGYDVYTVKRGSPAETAGLRAGDLIVSVDGKPIQGNGLSGTAGQRIKIEVRRGGRLRQITLEIKEWKLPPDSLQWLNKQTAIISVRSFTDAHYDRKLIEKLFTEAGGAKTMVIDLRGNGGGNADNSSHLLDMVLPSGTKLGTFVEKADVERFKNRFQRDARNLTELVEYGEMTISARSVFEADRDRFKNQFQREPQTSAELNKFVGPKSRKEYSGRILVVTDRAVGSGAEIFAQGIQDLKRGTVVGEQTIGQVLLADTIILPGKFELHIVTADYITIIGKRIEGKGVKPDVVLSPEIVGSDKALHQRISKILVKTP
ncbi:MAG: S41 family peptidase [Pyrinomonadaceae bacterium]